jgi:hypothetical protein
MRPLIEIPAANSRTNSFAHANDDAHDIQGQPICKAMECGSRGVHS